MPSPNMEDAGQLAEPIIDTAVFVGNLGTFPGAAAAYFSCRVYCCAGQVLCIWVLAACLCMRSGEVLCCCLRADCGTAAAASLMPCGRWRMPPCLCTCTACTRYTLVAFALCLMQASYCTDIGLSHAGCMGLICRPASCLDQAIWTACACTRGRVEPGVSFAGFPAAIRPPASHF